MKDEIKKINLSEMLFNRDERLLDYITNLQEENKRLEHDYKIALKLISRYEKRIDKAIEYINHYLKDIDNLDNVMINSILLKEILNILQGSDK